MIRIVRNLVSATAAFLLLAVCTPIARGDGGASPPARGAGAALPSVGAFLTPQGTLDLQNISRSGTEGSVDLSGYRMSLDPVTGSLVVSPDSDAGKAAPGDDGWWDGFGSPGVNDRVAAMVVYDGALIVAGSFTVAGGVPANRIARWDGATWSALGTGLNNAVRCLHVYDGKLIAGGWFSVAGGVTASRIAQWDGTSWSAVGSGFNSTVFALNTYGGSLIAGGEFTASEGGGVQIGRLARWDGAAWATFGGGASATVVGLGLFGTDLLVSGWFDQIGGMPIAKIARWDGTAWNAMGSWDSWGPAETYVVYQDQLYVGSWDFVKRWTGSAWETTGFPGNGDGRGLCLWDGKLVACGWGGQRAYAWDGTAWSALGTGLGWESGGAAAVFNGRLYMGGYFFRAGSANVLHIASWDGSDWAGVGSGPDQGIGGTVNALAVYQGDVIAGGNFPVAGGVAVNNIARWDGASWHPLAEGVTGWDNTVRSLFVHDGFLVVGGRFDTAGTTWTPGLARWDGTTWGAFGGLATVYAMVEFGGDLTVGGDFTSIGGVAANRVARWDGSQWHALGSGIGTCDVRALSVHGDSLIAGGCFTTGNGGPGEHVACWDGTNWTPLGTGLAGDVYALADYRGSIVAGGYFDLGNGYRGMARWDGAAWVPFGGSFDNGVRALSVINEDLYAGGGFGGIGWGPSARGVARYDGYAWNALGSGVSSRVHAIAEGPTGTQIYFAGEISGSGESSLSAGIVRWRLGEVIRPIVRSVTDIGNDQGRQVRLEWRRSKYDAPVQPVSITGYAVFREQGANKSRFASTRKTELGDPTEWMAAPGLENLGSVDPASASPARRMAGWDYILSVPACGDTSYQCVAPTLCDSTVSGGLCLSTFMIRALTASPFVYYDSAPLSGHSIDNLAPAAPVNLRFQAPAILAWSETTASDLDFYSVYGSSAPVFDPQAALLIGHTTTSGMDVVSCERPYLHVTATDLAGNEGPAAGIRNATTGVEGGTALPVRFALYSCHPNPTAGATVIRFDVPRESAISLRLFDVAGREVATLAHGRYPGGRHEVRLDAMVSGRLAAGVYLYRLDAGSFSETRKLQVIGR